MARSAPFPEMSAAGSRLTKPARHADGECLQTLVHPAISVWTVSTMPNGDIVTGCSDGVVRVFSSDEARWAAADQLKAYDDMVAAQALPAQQVGDVNKSDLPGPEALAERGALGGAQERRPGAGLVLTPTPYAREKAWRGQDDQT